MSIKDAQNGGKGRMSGDEDERGRESSELRGGGEDAFIYGGIALTAVWQRRPRQCLLEF